MGSSGSLLWGGALDLGGRLGGASVFAVMTLILTCSPQEGRKGPGRRDIILRRKINGGECGQNVRS